MAEKNPPANQVASNAEVKKAREAEAPEVEVESEDRYDKDGYLTRKGMEAVVAEGGSVSFNGQTLSNADDLPSAAEIKSAKEQAAANREKR